MTSIAGEYDALQQCRGQSCSLTLGPLRQSQCPAQQQHQVWGGALGVVPPAAVVLAVPPAAPAVAASVVPTVLLVLLVLLILWGTGGVVVVPVDITDHRMFTGHKR
jgi:hypothetical protein